MFINLTKQIACNVKLVFEHVSDVMQLLLILSDYVSRPPQQRYTLLSCPLCFGSVALGLLLFF